MSKFNQDILERNIRELLKNKGMTQQQLADTIGMSQSNVSKALSEVDKKCFTVEQIYSIADYFGVSIDWILGYETAERIATGPRAVGAFLAELLSSKGAKCTSVKIHDTVYAVEYDQQAGYPDYNVLEQDNPYLAIYFPNYWDPREYAKTDEELNELLSEATQCGNDTRNIPLNKFLQKYVDILKVFQDKQISEEAYQIVLKDYLSQLRES